MVLWTVSGLVKGYKGLLWKCLGRQGKTPVEELSSDPKWILHWCWCYLPLMWWDEGWQNQSEESSLGMKTVVSWKKGVWSLKVQMLSEKISEKHIDHAAFPDAQDCWSLEELVGNQKEQDIGNWRLKGSRKPMLRYRVLGACKKTVGIVREKWAIGGRHYYRDVLPLA